MLQSGMADPTMATMATTMKSSSSSSNKRKTRLTKEQRELRAAELDTRVVWGTYTIQKDKVTVTAKQSWQTVQFGLRIVTHNNTPYEEHTYLHQNNKKKPEQPSNDTKVKSNMRELSLQKETDDEEEHRYIRATDPITVSPHGRFGVLQLETHRSSASGNFDEEDSFLVDNNNYNPQVYRHADVVNYTVEVNQMFKFLPDPRF